MTVYLHSRGRALSIRYFRTALIPTAHDARPRFAGNRCNDNPLPNRLVNQVLNAAPPSNPFLSGHRARKLARRPERAALRLSLTSPSAKIIGQPLNLRRRGCDW
jgi:hypothetical protein